MDDDRNRVLAPPFVARAARWGIVAWAIVGAGVIAYFTFKFAVYPVRVIFPPLLIAVIVVYLLNPLVSMLERRGLRRGWAALVVYLAFIGVVGTLLYFMVPIVAEQVSAFIAAAPRLFNQVAGGFRDILARLGIDLGAEGTSPPDLSPIFTGLISVGQGIVDFLIIFVAGPILAFYFLVDLPKIKRTTKALIPMRRRAEVDEVLGKIGQAIGAYFRGQLLVAAFVGLASMFVLWFVGLPFWALVGLLSGLFNLIPLIGPIVGTIIAVLVAFTTQSSEGLLQLEPGFPLALGATIGLVIVQQIDGHILSPNIVGRTVKLHPVTVMLGVLAGATIMGLWGMLLAVPVLATAKILMLHAWDTRMTWPPPSGEQEVVADPGAAGPRPGFWGWLRGRPVPGQTQPPPETPHSEAS